MTSPDPNGYIPIRFRKGAEYSMRRKRLAREVAEQMGSSIRTVKRMVAEPREEYLDRARAKTAQAVELRAQGLTHREIGETMGISIGLVGILLHHARKKATKGLGMPPEPRNHDAHRDVQ